MLFSSAALITLTASVQVSLKSQSQLQQIQKLVLKSSNENTSVQLSDLFIKELYF